MSDYDEGFAHGKAYGEERVAKLVAALKLANGVICNLTDVRENSQIFRVIDEALQQSTEKP